MDQPAQTFKSIFNDGNFYNESYHLAYSYAEAFFEKFQNEKIINVLKLPTRNAEINKDRIFVITEKALFEINNDAKHFSYSVLLLNEIIGAEVDITFAEEVVENFYFRIKTRMEKSDILVDLEYLKPSRFGDNYKTILNFKFDLLEQIKKV